MTYRRVAHEETAMSLAYDAVDSSLHEIRFGVCSR